MSRVLLGGKHNTEHVIGRVASRRNDALSQRGLIDRTRIKIGRQVPAGRFHWTKTNDRQRVEDLPGRCFLHGAGLAAPARALQVQAVDVHAGGRLLAQRVRVHAQKVELVLEEVDGDGAGAGARLQNARQKGLL